MSMPTTAKQNDLRSRLPDPSQFIPEIAEISGTMYKATGNGSIPQTTIRLVQLRAGQIAGNTYHVVRQTGGLRQASPTQVKTSGRSPCVVDEHGLDGANDPVVWHVLVDLGVGRAVLL